MTSAVIGILCCPHAEHSIKPSWNVMDIFKSWLRTFSVSFIYAYECTYLLTPKFYLITPICQQKTKVKQNKQNARYPFFNSMPRKYDFKDNI